MSIEIFDPSDIIIHSLLSSGGQGDVHKVCVKKYGDEVFAGKTFKNWQWARRELNIHRFIDHPYISKLVGYSINKSREYMLIFKLYKGGDLFTLINAGKNPLSENEASKYIRQILLALCYLHSKKILHTDIKPENIVLDYDTDVNEKHVVLIDFGFAKFIDSGDDAAQTFDYMSPELLRGESPTYGSDMWALVNTAVEICQGVTPFYRADNIDTERAIKTKNTKFRSKLSKSLKHFAMCVYGVEYPNDRPSAKKMLKHPWIRLRTVTKIIKDSMLTGNLV